MVTYSFSVAVEHFNSDIEMKKILSIIEAC